MCVEHRYKRSGCWLSAVFLFCDFFKESKHDNFFACFFNTSTVVAPFFFTSPHHNQHLHFKLFFIKVKANVIEKQGFIVFELFLRKTNRFEICMVVVLHIVYIIIFMLSKKGGTCAIVDCVFAFAA